MVGVTLIYVARQQKEKSSITQSQENLYEALRDVNKDKNEQCNREPTVSSTEGPYYKSGSPQRNDIFLGSKEERIVLEGYVWNKDCESIANAWLDFWQADGNGNYDLQGYNLRGHQYTDENGKYTLETVIPGGYSSRTPHVHVKVRAGESSPVLTTQLYFPGESKNRSDSIFRESLVVDLKEEETGKVATFNFVLNTD